MTYHEYIGLNEKDLSLAALRLCENAVKSGQTLLDLPDRLAFIRLQRNMLISQSAK